MKIQIRDFENYKNYLDILKQLNLDYSDNLSNRYEYGKKYEQNEHLVFKVDKSEFLDSLEIYEINHDKHYYKIS